MAQKLVVSRVKGRNQDDTEFNAVIFSYFSKKKKVKIRVLYEMQRQIRVNHRHEKEREGTKSR